MKFRDALIAVAFVTINVAISSCGAYQRVAYLQDLDTAVTYNAKATPDQKILRGDRISITVSSSQAALSAPFNPGARLLDENDIPVAGVSSASGNDGYLVDANGNINFPVLGQLHVEGLSLNELSKFIEDMIISQNYIKEPIVKAEFVNFNVIVLGETGAGIYSIPTGNMNIFELLAKAGDLNDMADRENIRVIRTTGDKRNVYVLNVKSKDIYDSPAYYLQQNDIVYVPPLDNKVDAQITNFTQIITTPVYLITSLSSLVVMCIALFK